MRMTQEMDDDEKGKLFVGGLSWETTQENLQHYFSRYGEVIDCVVMKNNDSGRSRGFGFVTYAEPSVVNVVLTNGPHTLDGRTIDPKPCNPRTLQKPKRGGGYPKVFLGGLPSNVTETDLRVFFCRYGKVMEVVIMYDQEKKKSRGFGFLSFEDELSVERVTQEHYINLKGKQVEIKRAEPRDGSGAGGKMGSGGGAADGGQWGPPAGAPISMMQSHNGQMGGPPLNMPMAGPNIMHSYQGWGTSPGQGSYAGYGTPSGPGSYQGWGAPPGPQGPPPQWGNNYQQHPPQTQGYGSYGEMYGRGGSGGGGSGAPGSLGGGAGVGGGVGGGGKPTQDYAAYQQYPPQYQQQDQSSSYGGVPPRSAYGSAGEGGYSAGVAHPTHQPTTQPGQLPPQKHFDFTKEWPAS
ncbi:heterogeneous nuclear ribonucleoprotein at 27C isoform X2 [Arctopsyche grandis]|uniref:heterogeneous nuclear ribonucleoprotein at 27C isoform X2 n=1 Tax=Arctopsyche grandis TaxID=121162 RepID=UPI00406D695A